MLDDSEAEELLLVEMDEVEIEDSDRLLSDSSWLDELDSEAEELVLLALAEDELVEIDDSDDSEEGLDVDVLDLEDSSCTGLDVLLDDDVELPLLTDERLELLELVEIELLDVDCELTELVEIELELRLLLLVEMLLRLEPDDAD